MSAAATIRARLAPAQLLAACRRRGIDRPTLAVVVAGVLAGSTAATAFADVVTDAAAAFFTPTQAAECAAQRAITKETA